MNPSREELLFQLALSKPAAKRAAWLDAECDGTSALRQRLDALLAAHEASAGVLADEPAHQVLALTLDLPEPVPDKTVGMTLGRYKLNQQMGWRSSGR